MLDFHFVHVPEGRLIPFSSLFVNATTKPGRVAHGNADFFFIEGTK